MSARSRKSTQVALGGVATGLCLLLMFLTTMIPFAEYALPAFAGIVLIAVVVENGTKNAIVVYAAVSLLSLILVPRPEVACLFVFFFGYYPILQFRLDEMKPKVLQYMIKFIIFNIAVVAAYLVVINLFGITEIMDEFGDFGKYSALILLALGNVFFAVYDFTVSNLRYVYIHVFRIKFLRKAG